jgi:hypothetical protein
MGTSHTLDQLDICFDDTHAIASAGLLLPATLAQRLGIAQAADQLIDLGERPGAAHPGAKLLALVHVMVAGGTTSTTSTCCGHLTPWQQMAATSGIKKRGNLGRNVAVSLTSRPRTCAFLHRLTGG